MNDSLHSMLILSTSFDSVTRRDSTSNNLGVPALFGKIDFNWSAVDISICLHLSEGHICIFCSIPKVVSKLPVSTPKMEKKHMTHSRALKAPKALERQSRERKKVFQNKIKRKPKFFPKLSLKCLRKRTAGVVTYQLKEGQLKKVEGRSDQIPLMKNKGS